MSHLTIAILERKLFPLFHTDPLKGSKNSNFTPPMFAHEIVHEQSQCNNMIFQNSKLQRKYIF
jgi:hypothetical protein